MKRIFFLAAITASSLATIHAQTAATVQPPVAHQSESPQNMAKRMVSQVNAACHLHGDQFQKVNNTLVDYYIKFQDLGKQEASIGRTEFDKKLVALKATRDEGLKASLEPGQWQSWLAARKEK